MPEIEDEKVEVKKIGDTRAEDTLESLIPSFPRKNIKGVLTAVLGLCSLAVPYLFAWAKDFKIFYFLLFPCVMLLIICAAFLAILRWRSRPPKPRAIKEMSMFTEALDDATLLRQLGRPADIDKLVDKVRNRQSALVVVRGPAGCGISSVLRAGLMYALRGEATCYWRATPDSKLEQLQSAIQRELGEGDFRVLIIDQFEFLRPNFVEHQGLFSFLQDVCQVAAPYDFKVVIAFRQEYHSIWAAVEEHLGPNIQSDVIGPFDLDTAQEVLETILLTAGVDIDSAIVDRYASRMATDSELSPFLIGLATFVLVRRARYDKRRRVRLRSYWSSGGAMGVIADYLEMQLQAVDQPHRSQFLTALCQGLIDQASGERRIAGDSLNELALSAGIEPGRMHLYLTRLSSDDVRILERVETEPGSQQYRLAHACFAQALKLSVDRTPPASWSFNEQFERWKQTGKMGDLLRGGEIRKAMRLKSTTDESENDHRKYINKSRRFNIYRKIGFAAVFLTLAAGIWLSLHKMAEWSYHDMLVLSGLPKELYAVQSDLDSLAIESTNQRDLEWLHSERLSSLSVNATGATSLAGIGNLRNLQTLSLNLANSSVQNLAELKRLPSLTTLKLFLGGSKIANLADLRDLHQLEDLTISLDNSNLDFRDLAQIPKLHTLTLDLRGNHSQDLGGLSKLANIKNLTVDLDNSWLHELPDLTALSRLTNLRLKLTYSRIRNVNQISALHNLESLDLNFRGSRQIVDLPDLSGFRKLKCLNLGLSDTSVSRLPNGLENLASLETLSIDLTQQIDISVLPSLQQLVNLQSLTLALQSSKIAQMPTLPSGHGLRDLTLNTNIPAVVDIHKLSALHFVHNLDLDVRWLPNRELPNLADIHDLRNLTLHVRWSQLPYLPALPATAELTFYMEGDIPQDAAEDAPTKLGQIIPVQNLTSLTFYLSDSEISRLPDLRPLSHLDSLALHLKNSQIRDLGALSGLSNLTTLYADLEGTQHLDRLPDLSALTSLRLLSLNLTRSNVQDLPDLTHATQLQTLTLNLSNSKIPVLPDLSYSSSLQNVALNLQNGLITDLSETRKLPVTELILNRNWQSLTGLSSSVTKLTFGNPAPEDNSVNPCIDASSAP